MKQLFIAGALTALVAFGVSAETMTLGSTSYTVNRSQTTLAKGVTYTVLSFPNRTSSGYTGGGRVHVIEADLTEPTLSLQMENGSRMSGTKTLANHAAAINGNGRTAVAGANGNFWITSEQPWKSQEPGQPHGVAIRNGAMYTDPNVKTDAHCGGPAITGMLAVDQKGKVYIDRTVAQLPNNAAGSGVAFNIINKNIGHQFDLDQCNRVVQAGTASIYNRQYGADKSFRPVNYNGSTWDIAAGTCTEIICDLMPGEEYIAGKGEVHFTIKEIRTNAGTGTLGNHDLAIVGRDSYATVLAQHYQVGHELILSTKVNFESLGSPDQIMQAISGNILAMKDGVVNSSLSTDGYCKNSNERTIYATNAAGNKLYILVCEHNVMQSKLYFGFTTAQMCQIAKTFGATNAIQVDCGGSAQMYAGGKQVSQSYDASGIRGVYNGFYIVSTSTVSTEAPKPVEDEPTTNITPTASVKLDMPYSDLAISELSGYNVKRVIARGNYLYILGNKSVADNKVIVFDHVNKKVLRTLKARDISTNSTYANTSCVISDIAMTDDGILMCISRNTGSGAQVGGIMFSKWANDSNGIPTGTANDWNMTVKNGNWGTNDTGEFMAYSGTSTNGYIYYSSQSKGGTGLRWCRVAIGSNGLIASAYYNLAVTGYSYTDLGSYHTLMASPFNKEKFIVNGTGKELAELTFATAERGQGALSSSTSVLPTSTSNTGIFTVNKHIYAAAVDGANLVLADISNGLASAKKVTVYAPVLSKPSASFKGATGVDLGEGRMAIFLVRDNMITKLVTATESAYGGERAHYAHSISTNGNADDGYTVTYHLTGDVMNVTVRLIDRESSTVKINGKGMPRRIPNDDYSVLTYTGTTSAGINTLHVPAAELGYKKKYDVEVEVENYEQPASGEFFHRAPATLDARGGIGVVTDPHSPVYGYVVVSNGYAQGFDLYKPDLTYVGNYGAGMSPLDATNRSDTYRIGMRDGKIAYASAWSNPGAGFWRFDPEHPTQAITNLSAGTNTGTGATYYNGNFTGTGSSAVAFQGTGENTRVWSFAEDWTNADNFKFYGILVRWDIGTAEQITSNINAAYGQYAGAGDGAYLKNQNVDIEPYGDGIFLAQNRDTGSNTTSVPSLIYTNIYGDMLYNSGNQSDIIPTSSAAVAITPDGKTMAIAGYKTHNIRLYDVSWNGNKPSLSLRDEIPGSASDVEVCQLAFDPAGNLLAYMRSANKDINGLHAYAIGTDAAPIVATAAAPAHAVDGPTILVGVENVEATDEAPVQWYTLQGIEVDGDDLAPGVYIRRQGDKAEKVVIR